jgi:hypothetical protein
VIVPDRLGADGLTGYRCPSWPTVAPAGGEAGALIVRLDEDHPHHSAALYSLAQQYHKNGNSIGFGDTLGHLIATREKSGLPEDPLTLRAQLERVTWRAEQGDTTMVVRDLRRVVAAYKERHGQHHADTLAAEFRLAYWLWETGHPKEAQALLTMVQSRQRHFLDPRSPQIPATAKTLDRWQATPAPPQSPSSPPVTDRVNLAAARQLDMLLSRLAGRELVSMALLETLTVAPGRELSTAAWQATASACCATAVVEQCDLDALVAAADRAIIKYTADNGLAYHRMADRELARSVLLRAAQRSGLPPT